jgi:hypothetical protein
MALFSSFRVIDLRSLSLIQIVKPTAVKTVGFTMIFFDCNSELAFIDMYGRILV